MAHNDPSTTGQDRTGPDVHRRALDAAARIVEQSAQLEQAWLSGPAMATATGRAEPVLDPRNLNRLMNAPGYQVLRSRLKAPSADGAWCADEPLALNRARARRLVEAWIGPMNALLLHAPDDRLYVVTDRAQTELIPSAVEPPHTEGDVLCAALHVYGLPAHEDGEGGVTWLAVPQNSATAARDVYKGAHFRISCGEHTDRVASAHDDVWGASLYNSDGEHIETLDASPPGSSLAEDSARCARAVAERITG
ncbi:hypothetical protein [Streptomyces sp. NPDC057253]|uniref:hypothetical protein n=1 Tax=Streptomyces sp. NPDC057253 TaxID=3346069 RepID=UPI0036427ECD